MYTGLLITRAYFNEKKENVKFHSVLPSKYEVGRGEILLNFREVIFGQRS